MERTVNLKIIGLCGGSGSGKGVVSDIFLKKYSIASIDTDAVYHSLTASGGACLDALVFEFGDKIIAPDGSLDRRVLSDIVFSSEGKEKRHKRLNEIAHKFVLDETLRIIEEKKREGARALIIDAPLLYESGFDRLCDSVIAVTADREFRIERIMRRDSIDREKAQRRIASQLSDAELSARADFVIVNNGTTDDAEKEIEKIINKII